VRSDGWRLLLAMRSGSLLSMQAVRRCAAATMLLGAGVAGSNQPAFLSKRQGGMPIAQSIASLFLVCELLACGGPPLCVHAQPCGCAAAAACCREKVRRPPSGQGVAALCASDGMAEEMSR
jgi:hypothetical protein